MSSEHGEKLVHVWRVGPDRPPAGRSGRPIATLPARYSQPPPAGPLLGLFFDHSVRHLDNGLDRQQRAEQRLGSSDPAPLLQVLQRVDGAVHLDHADGPFGGGGHLVEVPAAAACSAASITTKPSPSVTLQRVDHLHGKRALQSPGRLAGGLDGGGHLGRQVDADHAVGALHAASTRRRPGTGRARAPMSRAGPGSCGSATRTLWSTTPAGRAAPRRRTGFGGAPTRCRTRPRVRPAGRRRVSATTRTPAMFLPRRSRIEGFDLHPDRMVTSSYGESTSPAGCGRASSGVGRPRPDREVGRQSAPAPGRGDDGRAGSP